MPVWTDPQDLSAENFNLHVAAGCFGQDASDYVLMGGEIDGTASPPTLNDFLDGLGALTDNDPAPGDGGDYSIAFDDDFESAPVVVAQPVGLNYNGYYATVHSPSVSSVRLKIFRVETGGAVSLEDHDLRFLVAGNYGASYWQDGSAPELVANSLNIMVAAGEFDTSHARLCGANVTVSSGVVAVANQFGIRPDARQNADGSYRLRFRGRFSGTPSVHCCALNPTTGNFYVPNIKAISDSYVDIELLDENRSQVSAGGFSFIVLGV